MKKQRSLEWFTDGIIFLALTGSLVHSLFVSLYIPIPFYKTVAISLLNYIGLSIFSIQPIISLPIIGAIPVAIWLFKTPLPEDWFVKILDFLQWAIYYPLGLAPFEESLVEPFIFLALGLLSIILYIVTIRIRSLLLPLILGASLIGIEWFLGHTSIVPYIWIFAFSLILIMARRRYIKLLRTSHLPNQGLWIMWTMPFAIITIISAAIIVPKDTSELKWGRLENIVEDIEEKRLMSSSFSGARQPYRLSSTGFSGSDDELGGPVKLNRDIVLEVQAPFSTYLRGSILNHYTGTSWKNSIEDKRYTLANKEWLGYRERAFDMDEALWEKSEKLASYVKDGLLIPYEMTIKHVGIESSVLFNAQFTRNISPQKRRSFVPYFNTRSETFTSKNIKDEDSYLLEGVVPRTDITDFSKLIDLYREEYSKEAHNDDLLFKQEYIMDNYTQLPDNLPDRISELAFSIIQDANNPYERVIRIQSYLKENFSYTLDTPHTPPNRDFVDYFLFDLEEGYCTYFASAMAVMLRSVGIPTRYIEGFSMPKTPDGNDIYKVRNSDGHAWVEVYFPNLGWLPFDPTPRFQEGSISQNQSMASGYEDAWHQYMTDYNDFDQSQENTNWDLTAANDSNKDSENRLLLSIIIVVTCLIALILLALILVVSLWYYSTRLVARKNTSSQKLMFYYNQILWLLRLYGFPPLPGETPYAYAKRVDAWLINKDTNMTNITRILVEYQYALIEPDRTEAKLVEGLYKDMEQDIRNIIGNHLFLFEATKNMLSSSKTFISITRD
ncbi:MAG: transglutaminase domain-containing protein [Clostridiales bacterium]|nr:transglutaminase domain-containing protein [Clostridiales bacterium]